MTTGTRARRAPAPPTADLLLLIQRAYGFASVDEVTRALIRSAKPRGRGDTVPSAETISAYAKAAATRQVDPRTSVPPLHGAFAHLAMNFLDGRRAAEGAAVRAESRIIRDQGAHDRAVVLCRQVLTREREARYERSLGNAPGTARDQLEPLAGAYALCRRETSTSQLTNELLILRVYGAREPHCHTLYAAEKSVCRGTFAIVRNSLVCVCAGVRADNREDVTCITLSITDPERVLAGFLSGIGTALGIPASMPVIAAKLAEGHLVSERWFDHSDQYLMSRFPELSNELEDYNETWRQSLEKMLPTVLFRSTEVMPTILREFDRGEALVAPAVRDFFERENVG